VSRWEKGLRAPQAGDAARLRGWLGEDTSTIVDVFDLRAEVGMTQRVFGAQFGVSRQQVQKWESGKATPRRSHLDKLVKLGERHGYLTTTRGPRKHSDCDPAQARDTPQSTQAIDVLMELAVADLDPMQGATVGSTADARVPIPTRTRSVRSTVGCKGVMRASTASRPVCP
jgi:transcriptional regulator with XRE-family HTH domain